MAFVSRPGQTLGELLEKDTKYTDMEIICGNSSFALHRVVMGTASPVFDRMLRSGFMEGKTGTIDLSSNSVSSVRIMVGFAYRHQYEPMEALTTHIDVYLLAHQYDMKLLMLCAVQYLKDRLDRAFWGWDLEDLVDAIRSLWHRLTPPDRVIREPIMEAALKYKHGLLATRSFLKLLEDGGPFVPLFVRGGYGPNWGGDDIDEHEEENWADASEAEGTEVENDLQ